MTAKPRFAGPAFSAGESQERNVQQRPELAPFIVDKECEPSIGISVSAVRDNQ